MESFTFLPSPQAAFFGFSIMSTIFGILYTRLLAKCNGNSTLRYSTEHTFKLDILIHKTRSKANIPAVALLDTQCHRGNWISSRLIKELGVSGQVRTDFEPLELLDANGELVKACGIVDLYWRCLAGNCHNWNRFHVLPKSGDGFDVILGAEFIRDKGLLSVNLGAILPLVEHKPISKEDKDAIDAKEKDRVRQQAELAARRNNQAGKQGSGGGQGTHTI